MRTIVARPKSWWIAAALVLAALVAHSLVTGPYYREIQAEAQAAMIERLAGQMSADQAEALRSGADQAALQRPVVAGSLLAGVAGAFLGWLLWAAGAHLGSLFFGGRGQFAATYAVTVWSQLPRALGYLVTIAYTWVHDAVPAHEGLGFLIGTDNVLADAANPAYLVLSAVTPATIWSLLLLIIGLRAATGLSRTAATILVALLWAIALAIRLVPAMLVPAMIG